MLLQTKFPIMKSTPAFSGYTEFTWRSTDSSTSNLTTYTFSGKTVGTAHANRHVIVGTTLSNGTLSGVTVGGVTATELIKVEASSDAAGLYIAAVPSGTTADIVVTGGSSPAACHIGWWTVNLASPVAHATVSSSGTTNAFGDMNIPANGFAVFHCNLQSTADESAGWTGVDGTTATEQAEVAPGEINTAWGHVTVVTAEVPNEQSVSWGGGTGSTAKLKVGASFNGNGT